MIQLPLNAQFVTNASGERLSALIPIKEYEAIVEELELKEDTDHGAGKGDDFIDFLLQGPVYSEQDIAIIEGNRKSIAAWRTKS